MGEIGEKECGKADEKCGGKVGEKGRKKGRRSGESREKEWLKAEEK